MNCRMTLLPSYTLISDAALHNRATIEPTPMSLFIFIHLLAIIFATRGYKELSSARASHISANLTSSPLIKNQLFDRKHRVYWRSPAKGPMVS
jgi:hypothetical protein